MSLSFLPRPTPDQSKQSAIHKIQIDEGIRTRNEVRAELGYEPVDDGDYLTVTTGSMVVRLDQVIAGDAMMPGAPSPEGPPRAATPSGASSVPIKGSPVPRTASPQPTSRPTPVHKIDKGDIADAAKEADKNPSQIQRKVGNYAKGHIALHGLSITIENAKGSKRGEKDRFGRDYGVKMPAAYGYIRGTIGADGMQVDCYLGKHPESKTVWVIDQDKYDEQSADKGFDEHKVMLAYKTPQRAIRDYIKSHFDDLGHERLATITQLNYEELKDWLKDGDMKRPISEQGIGHVIARRGVGGGINKADTVSQSSGLLWYDQTSGAKKKRKKSKGQKRLRSGPRWLELCA